MTELTEAELDSIEAAHIDYWSHEAPHVVQELKRVFAAARASLSPWREIESAPKDGTEIVGCWPSGMRLIVWWSNERQRWRDDRDSLNAPTHWCEIPPAPHSNGERDDGVLLDDTRNVGRGDDTRNVGRGNNRRPDYGADRQERKTTPELVALPSDAKPDVLCSVPDCPIHAPPPLESGEDAYACPLCGGWKHTGIGADECQCSPPPTPTQGEEPPLDKLQRLGQEFDASSSDIADNENGRKDAARLCNRPDQGALNNSLPGAPTIADALETQARERDEWKRLYEAGVNAWNPVFQLKLNELESANEQIRKLTAELERVRGYLKRAHEEAGVQEIELRAANEQNRKLREALEKIAKPALGGKTQQSIARAALKGSEGE